MNNPFQRDVSAIQTEKHSMSCILCIESCIVAGMLIRTNKQHQGIVDDSNNDLLVLSMVTVLSHCVHSVSLQMCSWPHNEN